MSAQKLRNLQPVEKNLVATSGYVPVGVLPDKGSDGRGRVALVK